MDKELAYNLVNARRLFDSTKEMLQNYYKEADEYFKSIGFDSGTRYIMVGDILLIVTRDSSGYVYKIVSKIEVN